MKIEKIAILFDESRYFDIFKNICKERNIEVMKFIPLGLKKDLDFDKQFKILEDELKIFKPDLIFSWQIDLKEIIKKNSKNQINCYERISDLLNKNDFLKVIFLQEDPGFFISDKKLVDLTTNFNYIFSHSLNFKEEYEKRGCKVFYRPCYYCSSLFKKPKENPKYKYDISFVGNINEDRSKFIKKISQKFPKLNFFWGKVMDKNELCDTYYNTKINLSYGQISDSYDFKGDGYPMKVLEIMASGGFVLTENRKNIKRDFDIGKDLDVFNSLEECFEKINFYLKNDELRRKITEKGYVKTKKNYNDIIGFNKILDTLEKEININ